jgi:small subunit ribosomal protein S6
VRSVLILSETCFEMVPSVSYWTMHFDANPEKQKSLNKLLRKDPRVIRATVLKMGERIEDVAWKSPKTIIPPRDEPKVP